MWLYRGRLFIVVCFLFPYTCIFILKYKYKEIFIYIKKTFRKLEIKKKFPKFASDYYKIMKKNDGDIAKSIDILLAENLEIMSRKEKNKRNVQ